MEVALLSPIGSALADPIISTRFIIVGLYQISARVTLLHYSSIPIRPDTIEAQPSAPVSLQFKIPIETSSQPRHLSRDNTTNRVRGKFVFNILLAYHNNIHNTTTILTLPYLSSSPSFASILSGTASKHQHLNHTFHLASSAAFPRAPLPPPNQCPNVTSCKQL